MYSHAYAFRMDWREHPKYYDEYEPKEMEQKQEDLKKNIEQEERVFSHRRRIDAEVTLRLNNLASVLATFDKKEFKAVLETRSDLWKKVPK